MRLCVINKDITKARLELDGRMSIERSRYCPISQSLKRRGFERCSTGVDNLWLDTSSQEHYSIPPKARSWISDFDFDRPVSPITFTIEKAAV